MKRYFIIYALMVSLSSFCNESLERDTSSVPSDIFVVQVPRSHILEARGLDLSELEPINLFHEYQQERKSTRKSFLDAMPQRAQEQQFLDSYEPYAFVDIKKLLKSTGGSLAGRTNAKDPQCILFARPKVRSHVNSIKVENDKADDTAYEAELELPILTDQELHQDSFDDIEQYRQSLRLEKKRLIHKLPQYDEPVYEMQSYVPQPVAMMPYMPQPPMVPQQQSNLAAYAMQLQATAMAMQAQASSMLMQSHTAVHTMPINYGYNPQYGYPAYSTQQNSPQSLHNELPVRKTKQTHNPKKKMRMLVMLLHDMSKKSEYDLQRLLLILDIELDIVEQLISGKRGALIEQLLRDKKNYLDTFGPSLQSIYRSIMEIVTTFDQNSVNFKIPQQMGKGAGRHKKEGLQFNKRKFLYVMHGKLEQIYQFIQSIH